MGTIAKKGLQQYLSQLQKHPLRTKAITAGVLSAVSDIVSQKLTGIQKLQIRRLLLKLLFGFAYLGPFGHFLHLLLDKFFKGKDSKTVAKRVFFRCLCTFCSLGRRLQIFKYSVTMQPKKHNIINFFHVLLTTKLSNATCFLFDLYILTCLIELFQVVLEQLTSSPWNNLIFMIYYGLVIESRPWINVKSKIKTEYPKVQYTAWTFSPVAGWINHQYVPLQFRVIFHSIIAFCWGIFLNLRARSIGAA